MRPPFEPRREEIEEIVALAAEAARAYQAVVDDVPTRRPNAEAVSRSFRRSLPESGIGAAATMRELLAGVDATVATSGPRCYHFVMAARRPPPSAPTVWPPPGTRSPTPG